MFSEGDLFIDLISGKIGRVLSHDGKMMIRVSTWNGRVLGRIYQSDIEGIVSETCESEMRPLSPIEELIVETTHET